MVEGLIHFAHSFCFLFNRKKEDFSIDFSFMSTKNRFCQSLFFFFYYVQCSVDCFIPYAITFHDVLVFCSFNINVIKFRQVL